MGMNGKLYGGPCDGMTVNPWHYRTWKGVREIEITHAVRTETVIEWHPNDLNIRPPMDTIRMARATYKLLTAVAKFVPPTDMIRIERGEPYLVYQYDDGTEWPEYII